MPHDIIGFTILKERVDVSHSPGVSLDRLLCAVSWLGKDGYGQISLAGIEPSVLEELPDDFDNSWFKIIWKDDGAIARANAHFEIDRQYG